MLKVTSKPGRKVGPGQVEGVPVYCLSGVRHEGGVSPVQASIWNGRTCRFAVSAGRFGRLVEGGLRAAGTVRSRVPRQGTGTDRLVVAVMPGNAGGAKGTDYPGSGTGQLLSGGRNR